MSIFRNTIVELAGYKAIVIKRVERGMKRIDQTSNSKIYKKNGKVYAKFLNND